MKKWLDLNAFLGVPATAWLYAAIAVVACYFLLSMLLRFVTVRIEALAERTSTKLADMVVELLKSTRNATILISSLLFGAGFLGLNDK